MLTIENYYSTEMNKKYFSTSQFKSYLDCEFKALAESNGEYEEEKSTALLVGSYVDSHFEKTLDIFKAKNSEIFTAKGELKSDYRHANYIIERIERDELFMEFMSGKKQVIKTGEIDGVPFKIKIDSYCEPVKMGDLHAIIDLKVMKDFERIWKDGLKLSFVEAWGYDLQGAIYQAVDGNMLPFYIAATTKEKPEPDLAIIEIPQERLDYCLTFVKENLPRFVAIKSGQIEPTRCEKCDYCKRTRILTQIISYEDVGK